MQLPNENKMTKRKAMMYVTLLKTEDCTILIKQNYRGAPMYSRTLILSFHDFHRAHCRLQEEFEDTKGVIRIWISKNPMSTQWLEEKVQKDKQRSTKHTFKIKDRVTRPHKKLGLNLGAPQGKRFLLHYWLPSY